MHEAIVEKLYNEYIANGFISEDMVFDILQAEGVPLFDIEYICDQLLAKSVIIHDKSNQIDDEEDNSSDNYKAIYAEILERDKELINVVEYLKNVLPPKRREWQNLLPQARSGNKYARNRIFEMYMRVAARIALHYAKRYNLPLADTMQDAFYGLYVAIDKFEYGRQNYFPAYFPFFIRQNILREAQTKNLIYTPVHIKDKLFAIYDLEHLHNCNLCAKYEICPNLISEIAVALGSNEEEAKYLYNLHRPAKSLEELLEAPEESTIKAYPQFSYAEDELLDRIAMADLTSKLNVCFRVLSPREQQVLRLRFGITDGQDRTLEEVGTILNVSRERVRQIETKALRKLRKIAISMKLNFYIDTYAKSHQKKDSPEKGSANKTQEKTSTASVSQPNLKNRKKVTDNLNKTITSESLNDLVLNILKQNNIEFVDKRLLGGALWIIGGHELDPIVEDCKKHGIVFEFKAKGGKQTKFMPGWWAK